MPSVYNLTNVKGILSKRGSMFLTVAQLKFFYTCSNNVIFSFFS